jgi:hypothetical protein
VSGGVFPCAKGRACTNLEAGNRTFFDGKRAGVTGDDKAVSDAQIKWSGWAKSQFQDPASVKFLELAKRLLLRRVNLKNRVSTQFRDPRLGKVGLKIRRGSNFQCVHGLAEDQEEI